MARKLKNWIGGFLDYTTHVGSPSIWRKWAALSIVSGALERRAFLRTVRGPLSPNMFVLLVGPPGSGKSVIIDEVRDMWTSTGELQLAPQKLTRAALIDQLMDSKKMIHSGGVPQFIHCLVASSSEFGNLVPAYENDWINVLNELYDCPKQFTERTRGLGVKTIDFPYLGIVAGTQPKYLSNLLPEEAFGMGFMSRFVLVYNASTEKISVFNAPEKSLRLQGFLQEDLKTIAKLQGQFRVTDNAKALFEREFQADFPPKPEHPKLAHYCTRRIAHVLKLAMIASAAEQDDLVIHTKHIQYAIHTLHEAELLMPQIFSEMATKGFADANEEAWRFVFTQWHKTKKPVPQPVLIRFLQDKVPYVHVIPTISVMVKAGMLKEEQTKTLSGSVLGYVPMDFAEMKK